MNLAAIYRTTRRIASAWAITMLAIVSACSGGGGGIVAVYSLGGSVSGLTGSGLVLANYNQSVAVSAGSTSFSFGPALFDGSVYAVTVQTQPAGQTCTVTDGAGTAGTANVGNVVVACSKQALILGGTVSGLTSAGLVLANGGDTVTLDAGATTFSFPAPIATGSSYAVTVQTQPAGLACAVTKGIGTMPASSVNTVAITCTDQPFNLGGSISGLSASGLVLANGTDTLTVNVNATSFTMPTKVAYGSHYAVTVQSPPTGLSCTVSDGSGTMPAKAVTTVAIVCADQSYLLGGAISGLTASGLVLTNGGDTRAVSSGATSFNMPTEVAYGSHYAVSVQTQPTGLNCTVSNATGTMPAGPVYTVIVMCATNTHTVGGTITGLTTSGLVLANGTDTTPPLGATATQFTMPTGVASGATYDVIAQTQPSGQLCTVSNGTGTVGAFDVTTVTVGCASNVVSFTTAGQYSWTVPDGVTSILVVATGGGGGGSYSSYGGGNGGVVTATLSVTAGSTLSLYVGGGGGTSSGAGGGGGSSNVNAGTADQIIAGGGGGAGGGADGNATGGDGGGNGTGSGSSGDAGNPSAGSGGSAGIGGAGGSGDLANGSAGGSGNGGPGGAGGDCGIGGIGGVGNGNGPGGAGGTACAGGGGGGGYGGGGGAGSGSLGDGGGGGGGSTGPSGAIFTVSTNAGAPNAAGGDGSIVITTNP
jgi:hypothetical protein